MRHACERARQRYGITLTDQDCEELCERLENGDGEFVGHVRNRGNASKIYKIEVQGVEVRVMYDTKAKALVTFLTKNQAQNTR